MQKWNHLTLLKQANTLADRNIDEIRAAHLYNSVITPIIQLFILMWITHNDIYISGELKATVRKIINVQRFKAGAYKQFQLTMTTFQMINWTLLKRNTCLCTKKTKC